MRMHQGTVYFEETGQIDGVVSCTDKAGLSAQARDGRQVISGAYSSVDFYVLNEEPVARESMDLSVSATEVPVGQIIRIEGIPEGTKLVYPAGEVIIDDGFIEWTALEPGTHPLYFSNFPLKEEVINACFV